MCVHASNVDAVGCEPIRERMARRGCVNVRTRAALGTRRCRIARKHRRSWATCATRQNSRRESTHRGCQCCTARGLLTKKRGNLFSGWVFFLIPPAHLHARPMGWGCIPQYVQMSGRNRIDPHWGTVERLTARTRAVLFTDAGGRRRPSRDGEPVRRARTALAQHSGHRFVIAVPRLDPFFAFMREPLDVHARDEIVAVYVGRQWPARGRFGRQPHTHIQNMRHTGPASSLRVAVLPQQPRGLVPLRSLLEHPCACNQVMGLTATKRPQGGGGAVARLGGTGGECYIPVTSTEMLNKGSEYSNRFYMALQVSLQHLRSLPPTSP